MELAPPFLSVLKNIVAVILKVAARRGSPPRDTARPDMKVSDAIDYVVNDSRARLNTPPPPKLDGYGRTVTYNGVEHQDARRRVNAKLISGELRSWGLRQINTHLPNQFELSDREITKEYWNNMQLDFRSCLYYKGPYPQTMKIPRREQSEHWADIRLSKEQLTHFWPRKSLWSRCYAKFTRKPLIAGEVRFD